MIRKIAENVHKKLIFTQFNGFCRNFCTEKNALQVDTRYVCSELKKIQFLKSFIIFGGECLVFLLFFGCFFEFGSSSLDFKGTFWTWRYSFFQHRSVFLTSN